MKIGRHISVSEGVMTALRKEEKRGLSAVQIFGGNPRSFYPRSSAGGKYTGPLEITVHAPYVVNLASPHHKALGGMREYVRYCNSLGATYLVIHGGSTKTDPHSFGLENWHKALTELVAIADPSLTICVENMSQGRPWNSQGSMGKLTSVLNIISPFVPRVGVCFDIAHAWGNGENFDMLMSHGFAAFIPLFHSNVADPNVVRGSRHDRHGVKLDQGAYPVSFVRELIRTMGPKTVIVESGVVTAAEVMEHFGD